MNAPIETKASNWERFCRWIAEAAARQDYIDRERVFWDEVLFVLKRDAEPGTLKYDNLEAAARRMYGEVGWPYPGDLAKHLVTYLAIVVRDAKAKEAGCGTGELADIRRANFDCVTCGGQGITSRGVPRPPIQQGGEWKERPPANTSFYCHRCRAGRAMKAYHEATMPEVHARMNDLRDFPHLQMDELKEVELSEWAAYFRDKVKANNTTRYQAGYVDEGPRNPFA